MVLLTARKEIARAVGMKSNNAYSFAYGLVNRRFTKCSLINDNHVGQFEELHNLE